MEGEKRLAWVNNTGRLHEFLVPGKEGFCLSRPEKGKTAYRLFALKEGRWGALIDTQFQMKALEKALESALITFFKGCKLLQRNVRLGHSRIDYLLACGDAEVYLEVKSAVLRQGTYAMYPDCPSLRGRKHVQELSEHALRGGKGSILFIAALPRVKAFRPNWFADAELCRQLIKARRAGVDIRAVSMSYNPQDHCVHLFHPDLPVKLGLDEEQWPARSKLRGD